MASSQISRPARLSACKHTVCPATSRCASRQCDIGKSKPDAAIFHLALEQAECAPGDAVMIGDRLDNDIRPANELGFRTVRILQGPGRLQQPREDGETPDATVADLDELAALFDVDSGG